MPDSHICLGCGQDLARVRVRAEPHYGFPAVTCPTCSRVAVRRPPGWVRAWRDARGAVTSLAVLGVQLALAVGLPALALTTCFIAADVARGWARRGASPGDWIVLGFLVGVTPVALGTWMTAGLAHWRRGRPWIVLAVLFAAILSLSFAVGALATALDEFFDAAMAPDLDRVMRDVRHLAEQLAIVAGFAAITWVVSLAGIPIGRLLTFTWRSARRAILRRRRARTRRGHIA